MVRDFILSYASLIVSRPEKLELEISNIDEGYDEITLYADPQDVGKLIGKEGRMINAIKTVISGCKAKGGLSYRINIKASE
jgi:predicted RNA-binding protein YlqC (UPF0109 family)